MHCSIALLRKSGNIKSEMAEGRREHGLLVRWLEGLSDWMERNWLMQWLGYFCPRLKDPSPRDTELYVVSCFVFGLVISIAICLFYRSVTAVHWLAYPLEALVYLLALLRVAEIIVRTTPINFSNVISRQRSLVLVAINYVELMVWFGLIYALNYQCLVDQSLGGDRSAPAGPITAFYFSIVTQLTIGYGDVYAKGWLRTIAALQGLVGALFVIVVLGRVVSAPQKAADDQ